MKDAHADGAGAGFFQRLDLAQADQRGKFIAFADDAFGGGGASGHGPADDVLGYFSKISFQFLVSGFQCFWHKKIRSVTEVQVTEDKFSVL